MNANWSPFSLSFPLSLSLSQAERNPQVKKLIAEHVPVLVDFVMRILKILKDTIDKVPFGIRWLCKATCSLVHEKFPETQSDTLNALIGGFFFLRYINPIIATPHGEWAGSHTRGCG